MECKRQRPEGTPLGRPITKIIECPLDTHDHQRRYCKAPATPRFQRQVITGSLLPAGDTLDRLLRYETHADRASPACWTPWPAYSASRLKRCRPR